MSSKPVVVHVEIRNTKGPRKNDLLLDADHATMADLLVSLAQQDWGRDLFVTGEERVKLISGYMMVLGSRMVQEWELESTPVAPVPPPAKK